MADRNDAALREHLVNLLTKPQAHATFDDAVKGLEPELQGKVAKGRKGGGRRRHVTAPRWLWPDTARRPAACARPRRPETDPRGR